MPEQRSWFQKFKFAFVGIALAARGQSSFIVHILMAIAVIVAAAILQVSICEWAILLLCITIVFTAEAFNSALERLAKAITDKEDENIASGLDIASGAVLIAAIGAAIVGAIVLGNRLILFLFLGDSTNGL